MSEPVAMRPIGVIRVAQQHDTAIQARYAPVERGRIEVDPELADALDGLDGFDFAWVLTWLDRADDPRAQLGDALRPIPFLLAEYGTRVGIFASRYPHRPNRIGLSLVRLERVDPPVVHFSGVDVLDGTPVLDIKPWISGFDLPPGARSAAGIRSGWFDTLESRPVTLDDQSALVLVARQLAGHAALIARTVRLDGLGTTDAGEIVLFDRSGLRAGRILSGAIDGALTAAAAQFLEADSFMTAQLVELAIDDSAAGRAGLACGGRAQIVFQPIDHVPSAWWDALAQRRPVALATTLGTSNVGSVVIEEDRANPPTSQAVAHRALDLLRAGRCASAIEPTSDGDVLVEATMPSPHLVVIGNAALAGDLVYLAGWLGWTAEHFTDTDLAVVAVDVLGPRDALVVLDHELTSTGPLLASALTGAAGYVGALGSRETQARRVEHLAALGVDDASLARLHGPAGLDIGGVTRAEIAMSICAEITVGRTRRSGHPLRDTDGPIQR